MVLLIIGAAMILMAGAHSNVSVGMDNEGDGVVVFTYEKPTTWSTSPTAITITMEYGETTVTYSVETTTKVQGHEEWIGRQITIVKLRQQIPNNEPRDRMGEDLRFIANKLCRQDPLCRRRRL